MRLTRKIYGPNFVVGELYNDEFLCYILEGIKRVPAGLYPVELTYSPRFKKPLPLLIGTAPMTGIRMHIGNFIKDTKGCLLPGISIGWRDDACCVWHSAIALKKILAEMKKNKDNIIQIQETMRATDGLL